jgi:hypothetical protein
MARSCTRKGRRSNRRSTRRGGAASYPPLPASAPNSRAASAPGAPVKAAQSCVTLLKKLLPDSYDFQRMQDNDYKNVEGQTYEQFVEANIAKVEAMSEENCAVHKAIFERISKGLVRTMDMEYASANTAYNAFIDAKGRVVVVTPR